MGSIPIKPPHSDVLYLTSLYYYPPAVVAVLKDSSFTAINELSGKTICVGSATTYEDWLNGVLEVAAEDIYVPPPINVTLITLSTDQACAQELAAGREDFVAYVTSKTVLDSNIADGFPVKQLGEPIFIDSYSIALDKNSNLDPSSLFTEVNNIVKNMLADGQLAALSQKWFGSDLTKHIN